MITRREKIMAVCVAFIIGIMGPSVLADIVSNWAFDEDTGSTAYDSAGGNNGNIVGATWTNGKIGKALSFNGSDNYVSVANNSSLAFTQTSGFTIAYWAKPAGTLGDILGNLNSSTHYNAFGYETQWDIYGRFFFSVESSQKSYSTIVTPNGSAPAGSWYFVAAVYDNRDMKIYLNGLLAGSGTFTGNAYNGGPDEGVTIGARSYDSTIEATYSGIIDEVRIYNNALSAGDIQNLYNVPEPGTIALLGLGIMALRRKQK